MRGTVIDIRGNRKKVLGKFLILLYILNLSDLIFTKSLLGVSSNLIIDADIFLKPMINGIVPYIIKIVLIGILLIYWYWRSEKYTIIQIKRSVKVSIGLLGIYGLLNFIHLINLVGYLFVR